MFESKYANIIHPTKDINYGDEMLTIVDIPNGNLDRGMKTINDLLSKRGIDKNEFHPMRGVRYGAFFFDCLLVQQSIRIKESVKFKDGTINYGKPYFASLEMYIDKVGSKHSDLSDAVIDFRNSTLKGYSDTSASEMAELIKGILSKDELKKKRSLDTVNGFGMDTLMGFLNFTVEALRKSAKENLHSIISSMLPVKSTKSSAKKK